MKIRFKSVTAKNFFAFGSQPTTLPLDEVKSTLIIARNGLGKTAITIDSISYALLGEAFRKVRKDQIVNSINNQGTLVTLNFNLEYGETIEEWEIHRGIKPDVLKIVVNGEEKFSDMRNSDKQKEIMKSIGIDKISLMNMILISANNTPFMRMDGPSRRAFVERVLNLSVFTRMHEEVKAKVKELKVPYETLKAKADSKEELVKRLSRIKENSAEPDQSIIDAAERNKKKAEDFIPKADEYIEKTRPKIEELVETIAKHRSDVQRLDNETKNIEARRNRLSDGKCPLCESVFHSEDHLKKMNSEIDNIQSEISEILQEKGDLEAELKAIRDKFDNAVAKRQQAISLRDGSVRLIEIESSKKVQSVDDELEEATLELADVMTELDKIRTEAEDFGELDKVFKSGKAKEPIISEYIPFFNLKINEYLEKFGLQVLFELDSEFNETIKARYKDSFSYESFSTGQMARIDLAIMLTWRDVASRLNSLETNVLVIDEFGSGVDDEGLEEISEVLNKIDSNVICIIPKEQKGMTEFDKVYTLSSHAGFSILAEKN
ncbi:recombination-related endonuclease [Agrobacterium phage Atu_ph04]|uniref:Recombination-related endonuclease n=1 Tax=Agrobacterium phage Atu_ph04 TaxID=2024263 RepID=A0A223W0R9_9CAUD|nr:SbcC-like subunit of palindrome specific endonuclease [Agrobacterium phage Atu_ph04]ASV44658.1 recombination-related endonuclease [Agrobacterium phage Atu_ph04]